MCCLFAYDFLTKTLCAVLISSTDTACLACRIHDVVIEIMFDEEFKLDPH